jgi:hypothetical protein
MPLGRRVPEDPPSVNPCVDTRQRNRCMLVVAARRAAASAGTTAIGCCGSAQLWRESARMSRVSGRSGAHRRARHVWPACSLEAVRNVPAQRSGEDDAHRVGISDGVAGQPARRRRPRRPPGDQPRRMPQVGRWSRWYTKSSSRNSGGPTVEVMGASSGTNPPVHVQEAGKPLPPGRRARTSMGRSDGVAFIRRDRSALRAR